MVGNVGPTFMVGNVGPTFMVGRPMINVGTTR